MNAKKLLHELNNNANIVYLDSSSLMRNYPINILAKNFTRAKYTSNPKKFSNMLNHFTSPLCNISALLYNIFEETTKRIEKISILTCDCMFPLTSNEHIFALFGSFDFIEGKTTVSNSTILYGDSLCLETFFNASTLIGSANLIIIDDYFLSLSVNQQLLSHKKDDTSTLRLSSIIGYPNYTTNEVIDIFNYLYSNYRV